MTTPAAPAAAPVKISSSGVKVNWWSVLVGIALTLLSIWIISKFVTNEIYDSNGNKTGEVRPRFGLPKMNSAKS
jgi:hypothetical protein